MNKPIYNGMSRGTMIHHIHMECDTSSGLYSLTDEQLITAYISVFGSVDK